MVGLTSRFFRIRKNLTKARARILVIGILLAIIVVVIIGTLFLLRLSYSSVVRQYQSGMQRTLQRVSAEFEGFEGRTAFLNMNVSKSSAQGTPVFHLPLDYLNPVPGHVEDLRPMSACSYPYISQPQSEICAAVLDSKKLGALLYIQGSFDLNEELTSPIYAKALTTGHHFLVWLNVSGEEQAFIVTFDPLRMQNPALKLAFSPIWSVNGFRYLGNPKKVFARDFDIKGRVLRSDPSSSHYRFIFQIPIRAFAEGVLGEGRSWPPADLSSLTVRLQVVTPDNIESSRVITDTKDLADAPRFTFAAMADRLAAGETLTFRAAEGVWESAVRIESSEVASIPEHISSVRAIFERSADSFIRIVVPAIATRKVHYFPDGSSVEFNGDASLVLRAWRTAAQGILGFALLLCVSNLLAGFVLYRFLLKPLNNVRRNTLYLRGRFKDDESFRLPYAIRNANDEIGVLWESIMELHESISSYGREALEKTNKQAEFLRALGHEIKSPLQELTMRHRDENDPSYKCIKRITHALKILSATPTGLEETNSGSISPRDAISAYQGTLTRENVTEYLQNAAAVYTGLIYTPPSLPLMVSADADMLEAALTAILNNASDFRLPGTPINITTYSDSNWVAIYIMNYGPHIPNEPTDEIFEYGVSTRQSDSDHQGLGLFMARQNVINMGGNLVAKNVSGGVRFDMKLVRLK